MVMDLAKDNNIEFKFFFLFNARQVVWLLFIIIASVSKMP